MLERRRSAGIDAIKGWAILAVLALHTYPLELLRNLEEELWALQAVPILIAVWALNIAGSMERTGQTKLWGGLYTWGYFRRRARRILAPLGVAWAISWALALWRLRTTGEPPFASLVAWARLLPIAGPGDYFVIMIITLMLGGPVLWWLYQRWPRLSIAGFIGANVVFEMWALASGFAFEYPFFYAASTARYLAEIALGFYVLHTPEEHPFARRNLLIWLFTLPALLYLWAWLHFGFVIPFVPEPWQPEFALTAPYAVALLLLGRAYLPKLPWPILTPLAELGKASWHIFLAQTVYFGVAWRPQPIPVVFDIAVAAALGYLFYRADDALAEWSGRRRHAPVERRIL